MMHLQHFRRRASWAGIFLALAVLCLDGAASATAADSNEAGLLQAELDNVNAMVQPDLSRLSQGFADELNSFTATEKFREGQFLDSFGNGRKIFRGIELSERTARIYGDIGITHGVQTVHFSSEFTLTDRYMGVYVKRDGRWQLVGWQSTSLREPDKGAG